MLTRAISALEYPKVLSYLASFAASESGQQACLQLKPGTELKNIRYEADLYDQACNFLAQSKYRAGAFPFLGDFLTYMKQPAAVSDVDGFWALRRVLDESQKLVTAIGADEEEIEKSSWPLWVGYCFELPFPDKTLSALNRCISDDANIKDGASPELSAIRSEIRRLHRQCTTKVKDYAQEHNIAHYLQDEFMTLSSDRYVLPLKVNYKRRIPGIVHDYSQTGETCYFEPMFLVEVNNQLQELKREEREEEHKVLEFLGQIMRSEMDGVLTCYDLLIKMDMEQAKSRLASCYQGRIVDLGEDTPVFLKEARHPLLALAHSKDADKSLNAFIRQQEALNDDTELRSEQEKVQQGLKEVKQRSHGEAVPSSIELNNDQYALVISGGNAGGKTVSLKTAGLIALMARAALPVPVEPGSSMPLWANISAFIGDEQSLEDHLSTFTAQINHLSTIWPNLSKGDLVILDEFGAGTDPAQGAALAQAVIDSLVQKKVHVLAATHFPALKAYALSAEGVRAASVLFDPKTKKPMFRLVYDQVGASLALDVAREHGLPKEVLTRAEEYLLTSGSDTSSLVDRLNDLAVEREEELKKLKNDQEALKKEKFKLSEDFEKERKKLFDSVQAEAQKVLTDWKKGRRAHRQTLKELSKIRTSILPKDPDEDLSTPEISELEEGMKVRHIPWKRVGTVQEIDERRERARIDLDGMSLWTDVSDLSLEKTLGTVKERSKAQGKVSINAETNSSLSLDLRGNRADIAIEKLEKFLDDALLEGRYSLEVIHGKGTGVLRRELHEVLKETPFVASFRLAPDDRGGDGMTMVELK